MKTVHLYETAEPGDATSLVLICGMPWDQFEKEDAGCMPGWVEELGLAEDEVLCKRCVARLPLFELIYTEL